MTSTRRRSLAKWLTIGAGTLCLLTIAFPLGALKYSEHQVMSQMTPEQKTAFHKWYNEKTSVTDEEIQLEPFGEPLVTAMNDFSTAWATYQPAAIKFDKAWQDTAYDTDASLSDEFLAENAETLAGLAPFLEAFKQVVKQPDYSIEAWETLMPAQTREGKHLKQIRSATRLIYARGVMNARAGNIPQAIDDADTLVAYAVMNPYNSLLHKMFGMAGVEYGLEVYQEILARSPNAQQEKQIFDQLWARLPSIKYYPDTSQDSMLLDHIGMTAPARRSGLQFSIENLNGYEIMLEVMRVQRNHLEQVVLPAAQSDKIREQIQEDITSVDESLEQYENRGNWLGAYRNASEQVMAASSWMVATPAMKRASENANETFKDYNSMLQSLSKATR